MNNPLISDSNTFCDQFTQKSWINCRSSCTHASCFGIKRICTNFWNYYGLTGRTVGRSNPKCRRSTSPCVVYTYSSWPRFLGYILRMASWLGFPWRTYSLGNKQKSPFRDLSTNKLWTIQK